MNEWLRQRMRRKKLAHVRARAGLTLEVSASDIASAKPKDPQNCAFACAVKRGMGASAAYFIRTKAYVEFDDRVVEYELPTSMQKEIVAFDRAKAMEPGVYDLKPIRNSKRPGTPKHEASRKRQARKRRRKKMAAASRGTAPVATRGKKAKRRGNRTANIRTLVSPP